MAYLALHIKYVGANYFCTALYIYIYIKKLEQVCLEGTGAYSPGKKLVISNSICL